MNYVQEKEVIKNYKMPYRTILKRLKSKTSNLLNYF